MAGAQFKKRGRDDGPKSKTTRPSKKLRKQLAAYHSSSDDDAEDDTFQAVNLLDSDEEDIHNALADDGADSDDGAAASSAGSEEDAHAAAPRPNKKKTAPAPRSIAAKKAAPKSKLAKKDAPSASEEDGPNSEADDDNDDELDENDEYSDLDDDDDDQQEDDSNGEAPARSKPTRKSKRADPDAFATSLSKILATKLSATRRADPVLARSAEAQQASRQAVDAALENKARKKLRDQKRLALEKGSVRDVLAPTPAAFDSATGAVVRGQTTAEILERERRLRKVAQRGVVQLFNAFRTAQVKAAEAERATRKVGVVGMDRKKEKVTEMSKKGFLDLIAAGGGGLKKGPLEEA